VISAACLSGLEDFVGFVRTFSSSSESSKAGFEEVMGGGGFVAGLGLLKLNFRPDIGNSAE